MKKSVKITIGVIVAVIVIAIICLAVVMQSGKKAITIEEFDSQAKELGYIMSEMQSSITEREEVTGSRAAISEDYSYLVTFYTLKDNDTANNFYNEQKETFDRLKQEGNEPVESKGRNYQTYTLKVDGKYNYISKVDNTIIQLTVSESEEQKVNELIKKIGY